MKSFSKSRRTFLRGLGVAMALLRLDLLRPALILLVLLYSVLALARLAGLWLDGGTQQTFNLYALLLEAVSAALAWWALRVIQRET